MSLVESNNLKANKNCLLVFRNKKLNIFDGAENLIKAFAGAGYYFDRISYVAYDKSDEIVRALNDGKTNYENMVIYCPFKMEKTLKDYISNLYSSEFNELGILKSGNENSFMFYADAENRLRIDDIKKILDEKYGVKYEKAYVKTVNAPPQQVSAVIAQAKNICQDIYFNVSDSYGNCSIETVYSSNTSKMAHDAVLRCLVSGLNDYVYAIENVSLAERLFQLLKLRRMKLSVAESFTGGGVGKSMVEVPGVSEVYFEGLNTYSNESKIKRLSVSRLTLQQYGAVSEQTAAEMAEGLIKSGDCDISIATTGIAGPKSDNSSKPVGLIYIAVGTYDETFVYKYNLKGDREEITSRAINLALFHAYKILK